jgi:hypothetical protein
MISEIISAISRTLHNTWGDGYEIYKEYMPQHFNEPCFSITHVGQFGSAKLPNRHFLSNRFDIQFFPINGQNEKSQMYNVADELYFALQYIKVLDNLVRGTKMSSEIVDGVLHFFVNYDMFVIEETNENPHMTEVTSTQRSN